MDQQNSSPSISVPTYDELLWPTLKARKAVGGSASNEELLAKVIELEQLPEAVVSFIHTGNRSTKVATIWRGRRPT